jgi:2-dehydro-3-deoxyphosphogalactonate aldolase
MRMDDLLAAGAPPIAAILRGLSPGEALPVAAALIDAGIRIIEVPANSPEPFESIERIAREYDGIAAIGGGTIVSRELVDGLARSGGSLMVTPNSDPEIIAHALALGLEPLPGFMTPTEAFRAVAAGARRLKLFPAASVGPTHLRAIRDVLPADVAIWAVGGTGADTLATWLQGGAQGIGVGGSLYRPGMRADEVGARARMLVDAWQEYARR